MNVRSETRQYGEHERQELTVRWRDPGPCEPRTRPGVIVIHGGYWAERSQLGTWPEKLAQATGWVVIEPQYRLNTDAVWPAARDDLRSVIAWAARHGDRYGIDPARLALVGSSAGGHLAAAAAVPGTREDPTGRQEPSVRAVVGLSPPLSPYRAWRDGERPTGPFKDERRRLRVEAARLAGCPPSKSDTECWDTWRDMVVKNHADATNPPAWFGYFRDDLVPAEHGEDYRVAQAEEAAPAPVQVLVMPGTGHGMSLLEQPGVTAAVLGFLAVHLTDAPPFPVTEAELSRQAVQPRKTG